MSEREQGGRDVGAQVNASVLKLLQQNVNLTESVIASLINGGVSKEELAAALLLMEKTNAAAREVAPFVASSEEKNPGAKKPLQRK